MKGVDRSSWPGRRLNAAFDHEASRQVPPHGEGTAALSPSFLSRSVLDLVVALELLVLPRVGPGCSPYLGLEVAAGIPGVPQGVEMGSIESVGGSTSTSTKAGTSQSPST